MINKLYKDIGNKIKDWAQTLFVIEIICSIIAVIILLSNDLVAAGIIVLICAPIIGFVSTWTLYAFGQLVDDIHALRNKACPPEEEYFAPKKVKTNTYHTSKDNHCDFCLRNTGNLKIYKKVDNDGETSEFRLCEECAKNNGYL